MSIIHDQYTFPITQREQADQLQQEYFDRMSDGDIDLIAFHRSRQRLLIEIAPGEWDIQSFYVIIVQYSIKVPF